jgi:HEAT repeat protein
VKRRDAWALRLLAVAAVATVALTTFGSMVAAVQPSYEDYVRDLKNTDPNVRIRAMGALAGSGYPQALVPLASLLTDPEDEVQLQAIEAVMSFYAVEMPPSKRRVGLVIERREKGGAAQRLFDQGPFVLLPRRTPTEVLTGLAGAMRDLLPRVRLEAIYALGVVGQRPLDPAVADVLQGGLRDPETVIRVAAARVIGGLRVAGTGEALIAAMNDPEQDVRTAAMLALGDVGEARAVQALTDQFKYYEKGPLAEAAFDGLARIGHRSSIPVFQAQLSNKSAAIRRRAAEGLAKSGDRQAAAAVETALANDGSAQVKLARAFALTSIGKGHFDELVSALREDATQAQAMAYLVELGRDAVPQLTPYLKDPEPRVRARVAMTLGLLGGDEAVAALQKAQRDSDIDAARAIERAIARAKIAETW